MIWFGSVGSMHSNWKLNRIFSVLKIQNWNRNRTENLAMVRSVSAGLFGSSVFCTPLVVLRLFHSGFDELGMALGVFFLIGFSLREQSIISCVWDCSCDCL